MRQDRTLGLAWFGKVQNGGIYHQDWRIENDPQADAAFRLCLSELNLARPSRRLPGSPRGGPGPVPPAPGLRAHVFVTEHS